MEPTHFTGILATNKSLNIDWMFSCESEKSQFDSAGKNSNVSIKTFTAVPKLTKSSQGYETL